MINTSRYKAALLLVQDFGERKAILLCIERMREKADMGDTAHVEAIDQGIEAIKMLSSDGRPPHGWVH